MFPLLQETTGHEGICFSHITAGLADGILEKSEQLEAIEGALEIEKAELIAIAKPFYFAHHAGQMAVASSIEARSGDKTIRVGFSNSYPEAAVEELIGELQELFARHHAGAALSAKAVFKPNKDFHTARHALFTPEQNLEIDKIVPVGASVKTKLGMGGEE